MNKIVINALSALKGGGQTYLKNLLKHTSEDILRQITLIVSSSNYDVFKNYPIDLYTVNKSNLILRTIWEFNKLPKLLKNSSYYFAPGGTIPLSILRIKWINKIVIFRNMLPFDKYAQSLYKGRHKFKILLRLNLLNITMRQSYIKADKVIFISSYAEKIITRKMNVKDSKLIYHGVDHQLYNIKNKPEKYIVYVSHLSYYKSQIEVLKNFSKILKEIDREFKLVLIGHEVADYGERVRNLINELKIKDNVILTGALTQKEITDYYQKADFIIFASVCENCPNTLIEGMASKIPIFCSNYEPMPEIGQDNLNYFDPKRDRGLFEKFLECYNNKELLNDNSEKAYKRAKEFNWKDTVQKTWDYILN